MSNLAMQGALLLMLAGGAVVEMVEDNRFKVSVTVANAESARDSFNAQMAIIQKAQKVCKNLDRGRAVSEGTLHLDTLPPPDGKKKGAMQLSEFYSCAAK